MVLYEARLANSQTVAVIVRGKQNDALQKIAQDTLEAHGYSAKIDDYRMYADVIRVDETI